MQRLVLISCLCLIASFYGFLTPWCRSVKAAGPVTVVAQSPVPPFFDKELFETAVRALEAECPLNAPAMVGVVPIQGAYWGLTWWDEKRGHYVIQIDGRQPMHSIIATLEHEWAHAMVWDATQREGDDGHGPLWGVAQARCYRVVLDALTALGETRAAGTGDGPSEEPDAPEDGWEAPTGKVPRCSH